MKRIKNTPEFLVENGLLFEINRLILHPLGLALEIELTDDGKFVFGKLWDCRDDAEGVLFSPDTWDDGQEKLDKYMKSEGKEAHESRKKILGFIVQDKAQ